MARLSFLARNAPFLGAGALLTFGSSFGQTFFISIFAEEIQDGFGLSHGGWGLLYTAATTLSAIAVVWAGGLTDRFRVRALGLWVIPLLAGACLLMAVAPGLWTLGAAIFLLRFAGQGMMSHIGRVAIARWFIATRGKALSVANLGFSFGEAVLPILFVALLARYDWRLLWAACALAVLLLLPVLLRLLRLERVPQHAAEEESSSGLGARHWTRPEVLRHRLFWLIIPALLGPPAFGTAFFFQQVHYAEIKGWSHLDLVALFPLYTAVATGSMLVSGVLIDRIGALRLMPIMQVPFIAAFLLFALVETPASAAFAIAIFGLSTGAMATVPASFWAEAYGTRHLGAIKAMSVAIMVFGSAIGPGLTGVLIDAGLGLETQMIGMSVFFAVAGILSALGIAGARRSSGP
ncbi:MFS transporter [Aestuariibius insulae]|uniref:MFS transporter n=1 Tax=Aestuariibius insulae TaxID=2058287 RepID=UPI00345E74C2